MKSRKSKRFLVLASAAIVICFSLLIYRSKSNSLRQWGFAVSDSSVVIDENPWNLTGEEKFVKANLTRTQASALYKSFKSQPTTDLSPFGPLTPQGFPPLPGNPKWTPQTVKKYWAGGFKKKDFYCEYIFDVTNTNNKNSIVLYFYAVTFDN